MEIYHGSEKIIEKPIYGQGKKHNDFGVGFYCTENVELAKEWAVSSLKNGFSNHYQLDTSYLRILNLNTSEYTILNWISTLLENRLFSIKTPVANRARKYLIENFSVNVNAYDVVIGFRADDSYFDYAEAFINNSITVEQLALAMKLGKLGEQIVIKSEYAFSKLSFKGYEVADKEQYYIKRKNRNDEANQKYIDILEHEIVGLFVQDILRGGIGNDDPRIPRNI